MVLEDLQGATITCASESSTGELKAATTIREVVKVTDVLQGCELAPFSVPCTSVGAPAGEVVTSGLKGPVKYIRKPPGPEVGLRLTPEVANRPLAKMDCGMGFVTVYLGKQPGGTDHDSVIAPITPLSTMGFSKTLTYTFTRGGYQVPQQFAGSSVIDNLEAEFGEGPGEMIGLSLTSSLETAPEEIEIRGEA